MLSRQRGIALPILESGDRRWWEVIVTPRPLYPPEKGPGSHCAGDWVGLKADLNGYGKFRPTGVRSSDRQARSQ